MVMFRIVLVILLLAIGGYTAVVISNHGWNLIPIFFRDIASLTWPGQFNLDFSGFLLLSGLWLAWRHHFSPAGFALGLLGATGGMLFLSLYLLITSYSAKGDIKAILLGERRARA